MCTWKTRNECYIQLELIDAKEKFEIDERIPSFTPELAGSLTPWWWLFETRVFLVGCFYFSARRLLF